MRAVVLVIGIALFAGCDKIAQPTVAAPEPAVISSAPAATPVASAEDWKRSALSTYIETEPKTDGEGITRFMACFEMTGAKCTTLARGERDAFRKMRFFTPSWSTVQKAFRTSVYIRSYVALPDCAPPIYFLQPYYGSKGGWIFLSNAAVMLDGEVVLQQEFSKEQVDRDNDEYGVQETYHFVATDEQIASLRKVANGGRVIIRLTGSKGFVTARDEDAKHLAEDMRAALTAYDKLKAAHIQAKCT